MKKITTLLFAICSVISFQAQTVFINEIHYDNTGGDVDEAVEIAGPAGTDVTGWTLQPYNGSNGLAYGSMPISGTIPNESNGFGTLNFYFPTNGLQNGAPDGIALIDDSNNVIQFLSYEGAFTANDGPAVGMMSVDIGVSQSGGDPIGESLQLIGSGNEYADFTWSGPSASSPGSINSGQTFTAPPPPPSGQCSTDTPQDIEDFSTINSVVTIANTGIIGENSFEFTINTIDLDMQHDRASDMVMTLTSPEGTVLTLFENNGGVDGLDTQANLVFDDAGVSVGTWVGGAPAASYSALDGLFNTVFAGEEVNGDWTLTISDQGGQTDEGTLFGFCLDITDNGLIGTVPQISCPGDIDTETDEGLCGAEVTFGPASAIDAEDGALAVTQTAGPTSGDFLAVGTYDVTYEATDTDGNTVECTFTITVTDEEAPVAVGQDITVTLDAMGFGSITPADVDGGSSDNCGIDLMTLTQTDFDCSDVGDNEVTLTVEDEEGNTDSVIVTVTVVDDLAPVIACVGSAFGLDVFINEIHYDNAGADADEAVEIAGPEGTDLTGWSIVLYNGNNGSVYDTENLTGTFADQNNGFGTLNFPISGIQNGSPDGIALVDDSNSVIQFLSYEGAFAAVDGPAVGMMSEDIGVSEASSTPIGESLQLSGTGTFYGDFTWNSPATSTPGAINNGQTFVAAPSSPSFQLVLVEGTATMQAADFLDSIDEACGYTVTVDGEDFINFTCADIGSHQFEVTVEDASGNIATCMAFVDVVDPSLYCELACSELENPVDILDFEPVDEVAEEVNEGIIGANSFQYTFNTISIDLQHDRASDLVVSLTSPSGTSVVLTENNGGVDGLDAQAVLVFDDMAGANVTTWSGGAPAASYMAEGGML
ncbi:proprotein convertase P-domain-containing protein, partial [Planktosalinus lacus]|uniref:proprotein convertase P-domain-containing protein n=1 Tax=Planktosalinus lacus TaxID=1526573 RepID=UPI001666BA33